MLVKLRPNDIWEIDHLEIAIRFYEEMWHDAINGMQGDGLWSLAWNN